MIKYFISIIAVVFFAISCSHGITVHFPNGENLTDPAEIILIRNRNFSCGGQSTSISLDGVEIAHLRIGDYVKFLVEPESHGIIAKPFMGSEGMLAERFEAGKK